MKFIIFILIPVSIWLTLSHHAKLKGVLQDAD